jgi:hypothetical protein
MRGAPTCRRRGQESWPYAAWVLARVNARFRDVRTVGAALVTLAVAAAAIGALATQGSKPSRLLVEAIAVVALVGVVLVAVGWIGEHVTQIETVPAAHAETLRASAERLRDCLADDRVCDYGIGYRPRDAFRAHYPTSAEALDEWDALLAAEGASAAALHERVQREAHDVAMASEGRWALGSDMPLLVLRSTLARARDDQLDADFSLVERDQMAATPLRDDGESAEDWAARIERNITRVEAFGRASQDWPEAQAVRESHTHLEDFRANRWAGAIRGLQLILEHGQPLVARGCPTCEGEPR